VAVQGPDVSDEALARRAPFVESALQLDPAEVGVVVRVDVEARILAGSYGADPRLVALAFSGGEVGGDVAQVPCTDPRGRVFSGDLQHHRHQPLAVCEPL